MYLARFVPFFLPFPDPFPFPVTCESLSLSSVVSFVASFCFLFDLSAPDMARLCFSGTGSYHLHHVASIVAVEHLDQLPEMK
jgi:hypothetical protein